MMTVDYWRVWTTFLRNALIRELSFRSNFVITVLSRLVWFSAQLVLFGLIYRVSPAINDWSQYEYFGFMATVMIVNSLVEAFFMPNCANFSELIRTGNLDFALLKPVDTQFLVSCEKMDLAMITQVGFGGLLLGWSLYRLGVWPTPLGVMLYLLLVLSAVAFFYSLMIALACSSLWFGRNQGLLDFWFYVTIFARYPGSIYSGSPTGEIIRFTFSYVLPILVIMTVPARQILGMAVDPNWLTLISLSAGVLSLVASRWLFQKSLVAYRSASS